MKNILTIILAISFSNLYCQVNLTELRKRNESEIIKFYSVDPSLEVIENKFLEDPRFKEDYKPETILDIQIAPLRESKSFSTRYETLESKKGWKIKTKFKQQITGDSIELEFDLFLWETPDYAGEWPYFGHIFENKENQIVNGKHIVKSRNAKPISFAEFKEKVPLDFTEEVYNNTIEFIQSKSPLNEYRIVVFTANSWCGPCVMQLKELNNIIIEKNINRGYFYFIDYLKDWDYSEDADIRYTDNGFKRSYYTFITQEDIEEKDLITSFPIIFIFKNGKLVDASTTLSGENLTNDLKTLLENNGF